MAAGQCVVHELHRAKISKFEVQMRKIDGGMANLALKHYFGWPSSYLPGK